MNPIQPKPRARVMWAKIDRDGSPYYITGSRWSESTNSVAVLPLPATRARKLVKFANMTEEEKVEQVAELICVSQDEASTILQSLGLIGGGR